MQTVGLIAVAGLFILLLLFSFGLPFFSRSEELTLPTDEQLRPTVPEGGASGTPDYTVVQITPTNVQAVIGTLARQAQYYREWTVQRYWGSVDAPQEAKDTVLSWNDGENSRTTLMTATGTIQNCIVKDGTAHLWYSGQRTYRSYPVRSQEAIDLTQNIPTYESVLSLKETDIVRAGYETYETTACIFVEARIDDLGYLERYWVSVESGLLFAAETVREVDDMVLYRMYEKVSAPLKDTDSKQFTLPDGTLLHSVTPSE